MILATFFILGLIAFIILALSLTFKIKWLAIVAAIFILVIALNIISNGLQIESGLNSTLNQTIGINQTSTVITETIIFEDIDLGFGLGSLSIGILLILIVLGLIMFIVLE